MTKGNGLPCTKCGTSEWDKHGNCKECKRDYHRQWAQNNKKKMVSSVRRWQRANPDRRAEHSRKWNHSNPEKRTAINNRRRTRATQAGGSYTVSEFNDLCAHYGHKCLRCGRIKIKLTADHINPVSKGGSSNIENIQPLCSPCNSAKGDRNIDYRPDAGTLRWLQCKLFG